LYFSCRVRAVSYTKELNNIEVKNEQVMISEQGRNAYVLLNACKDIGLAVNTGKTKYMEIEHHRGVLANGDIKIGSNSYGKVKTFKYLGTLLTNQNYIQEEIKCRLKGRL